jgi:hypothetical protein
VQENTYTWSRTKIKQNLALLQESILLVQLDQLERSTIYPNDLFRAGSQLVQVVTMKGTLRTHLLLDRHFESQAVLSKT